MLEEQYENCNGFHILQEFTKKSIVQRLDKDDNNRAAATQALLIRSMGNATEEN